MAERTGGEMLFAPKERMSSWEKIKFAGETQIERVARACARLLETGVEKAQIRELRLNKPGEIPGAPSEPKIEERSRWKTPELAMRMPETVLSDVRADFVAAFPKQARLIESTPVEYWIGQKKVTEQDLRNFMGLLTEEDTLMGEAYPFYELLTQKLSEKAAAARGGWRGKIMSGLAKIIGWTGYKLDLPVGREWSYVENGLEQKFGQEKAQDLVENMYFGEKEQYGVFKSACTEAGINFDEVAKRAKENSWFLGTMNRLIRQHPQILRSGTMIGGLNLPGKVYDIAPWFAVGAGGIAGLYGLGGLMLGMPGTLVAFGMSVVGFVPIAGVGILFHEMTHEFGGNFRRYAQNMRAKIAT